MSKTPRAKEFLNSVMVFGALVGKSQLAVAKKGLWGYGQHCASEKQHTISCHVPSYCIVDLWWNKFFSKERHMCCLTKNNAHLVISIFGNLHLQDLDGDHRENDTTHDIFLPNAAEI
mmetsp:Transcript_48049/g.140014  ORF Transcript_48049/g.140014 Transcript_48049/m.140014 type:complete len:117 (+) Transcript_48049:1197-1547(+)